MVSDSSTELPSDSSTELLQDLPEGGETILGNKVPMETLEEDGELKAPRAETPRDEKGRKPADVAEEEAFSRSYKEIRAARVAQRKAAEEADRTNVDDQRHSEAPGAASTQTLLEQLRPVASPVARRSSKSSRKEKAPHETSPKAKDTISRSPPNRGWLMGSMGGDATKPVQASGSSDVVKLPQLVHSQTMPGVLHGAAADSKESDLLIAKLQDELAQERLQREQVSQRVKQLEGELDKKLQRSASQPARFGVSKGAPYKGAPFPPPPSSPTKSRSVCLPALRTIPSAPSPQRSLDQKAAQADADSLMELSRNKELSRAERSKARIEAVKRLDGQGMNTWKYRTAEKVARLNDLTVFRDSMWESFYEWHEDYSLME
jgi:hypothetical protein